MKSTTVRTQEIDDIKLAVAELKAKALEQIELMKNSFGIICYDPDFDASELAKLLEDELGFPVIGCSATAVLDNKDGYCDMDASLIVLTADDCEFSASMTEPFDNGDVNELLEEAYKCARNGLTMKPELMISFFQADLAAALDECIEALSKVSGDLPIFGGLPSVRNNWEDKSTIIYNKECYPNRSVLLLISGNIHPLFAVTNSTERFNDTTGTITRSEHGKVYEINNMPFTQFLKKYCDVDNLDDLGLWWAFHRYYPLLVNDKADESDVAPYARTIVKFNKKEGSATCFANIPEGSKIALGVLKPVGIGESVREAIQELKQKSQDSEIADYHYSTILCVSCISRREVLNPHFSVEGDIICEEFPDDEYSFSGFYSFGEIAPVAVKDGRAANRLHNVSLVMCMF